MAQTREELTVNLAERLCWQVARRDDARVAHRLYRKSVVDGVYQLDEGAWLDDFWLCQLVARQHGHLASKCMTALGGNP
jgi:hypothetical protein